MHTLHYTGEYNYHTVKVRKEKIMNTIKVRDCLLYTSMLFQGAAAFKLWTGKDMPIEHMKEVLNIRYDD